MVVIELPAVLDERATRQTFCILGGLTFSAEQSQVSELGYLTNPNIGQVLVLPRMCSSICILGAPQPVRVATSQPVSDIPGQVLFGLSIA